MVRMTDTSEWQKGYAKVVAHAWSDDTYKDGLVNDPRSVLAQAGLEVPQSVEIAVVADTADRRHLVLPAKPVEGEIDEEALAGVSGGLCCCCCGSSASADVGVG